MADLRRNGKIVNERDDLLSAIRYCMTLLRAARVNRVKPGTRPHVSHQHPQNWTT